MTTALDTKLVPKTLSLVNRLGKTVSFFVPGDEDYNFTSGRVTDNGTPATHSHKVTPPSPIRDGLVNGDIIQRGDSEIGLPASGLTWTPVVGIVVTIDSEEWTIVNSNPVYSGDDIALYMLQIRKRVIVDV